jgi:S-DNA-T family DNA segregation ATPase FtsK/SpoIIIE
VSTKRKAGARPAAKKVARRTPVALLVAFRERVRNRFGRQADDIWGVVLLVVSVLIGLAFIRHAGPVGSGIVAALSVLVGVWAYAVPVAIAVLGVLLIAGRRRDDYGRIAAGLLLTFVGTLGIFHLMTGAVSLSAGLEAVSERGGAVGSLMAFPLQRLIGPWGAGVVLVAVSAIGILAVARSSIREFALGFVELVRRVRRWARATAPTPQQSTRDQGKHRVVHPSPANSTRPKRQAPANRESKERPLAKSSRSRPAGGDGYQLPPIDLLALGGGEEQSRRSLEETARVLEDTLVQHGVDARLTKIVPGPTVTRYEIELAPGVKVNRVTGLAHDIAYALATPDVRLLAPIPGRSAIGVEVPNRKRRLVTLGDVLRSAEAAGDSHPLEVGLGMDISGRPRLLNLSELPHLLIAGATGAGKSSCINSIVTSMLVRTSPEDVRLIMVDPKRVELGQYNGVPHLLTKVITNPKKAADALKWAVAEMDRRYDLIADARARDIIGYREKWDAAQIDHERFDRFPYIVVVVDELNDLMMVAGREVEEAIVRIAQMARAVGIHLVIATQRPSVDVITGVIKANIPSRLAFSVASQTDSRVIIDGIGAEKLVGMGDMLVITAKEPRPVRIQGAWVSEEEVHEVVEWVKNQREVLYQDHVIEEAAAEARAQAAADDDDEDSELIRRATELVVRSQLGSTSMLQRKLRVGFARAGRIMDILEQRGVVGPSEGSKARAVLMTTEELEDAWSRQDA